MKSKEEYNLEKSTFNDTFLSIEFVYSKNDKNEIFVQIRKDKDSNKFLYRFEWKRKVYSRSLILRYSGEEDGTIDLDNL